MTRLHRFFTLFALAALLLSGAVVARPATAQTSGPVLVVESGRRFTSMNAAVQDSQTAAGSTIQIDAGTTLTGGNALVAISKNNLTIRGVLDASGNRPLLDANFTSVSSKGTFVVNSGSGVANLTVENLEFIHSANSTCNGSGIRFQGTGKLTVRNSYFHDNNEGILSGPPSGSTEVFIESSIFDANGYHGPTTSIDCDQGQSHNMYITADVFTIQYSYTHSARHGHDIKTRSYENNILYNRIMDEVPDPSNPGSATASYEINVPNGGLTRIIGNVIEQGPNSENSIIVRYGEDGGNPIQDLHLINNTFINNLGGGTFINMAGGPTAEIKNNIFYGPGTNWTGGTVTAANNYFETTVPRVNAVKFNNPANYDFHLTATSPAIDAGTSSITITPTSEYVEPIQSKPRSVVGSAIDQGAFEFGGSGSPPDTTPPVISGLTVTNITTTGARVSWTTDDASDSQVEYALNSSFSPSSTALDTALVTSHSMVLTGLNPSTQYYVRVRSTNAASLTTTSSSVQFTTTTPPPPNVTGASGTVTSGSTVTLTGTNFGTKPTAAPLKFDTFEGGANGAVIGNGWSTTTGGYNSPPHPPVYSTAVPRTNPTKTAQARFDDNGQVCPGDGCYSSSNFGLAAPPSAGDTDLVDNGVYTPGLNLSKVYLDAWYYYDAATPPSRNHKIFRLHSNKYTPNLYMNIYCGPDIHVSQDGLPLSQNIDFWSYGGGTPYFTRKWSHIQAYFVQSSPTADDGTAILYVDGQLMGSESGNFRTRTDPATFWNSLWFGNYLGHDPAGSCGASRGNSYTYWDNVYVDTTRAHVEIGNAPTYAGSTLREVQPATSWSNTSIQITVSQGAFPDFTNAYAYVVDASGAVNANGFRLAVAPPTDTTPPVITGVTVTNITTTGARVSWTTDDPSDSQVEYSLSSSFSPSSNTVATGFVTSHSVVINGLTANTQYYVRVRSTNAVSLTSTSPSQTFQTASPAGTPVLVVETGERFTSLSAAITDSNTQAGNTIRIDSGTTLSGTDSTVSVPAAKNNLTIEGVVDASGNRPILDPNGANLPGSKGIILVDSGIPQFPAFNLTVKNIEFKNGVISDSDGANGSGIRFQGSGKLTVINCNFHDNQNGILAGNGLYPVGEVFVDSSIFTQNGYFGSTSDPHYGQEHNMYIDADSFTIQYSLTHGALGGHDIKTRSKKNYILYNRILDEAGNATYDIDIPNGGESYIIGNSIQQGLNLIPANQNTSLVSYGAEGITGGHTTDLYVVNNTLVNNANSGIFLNLPGAGATTVKNNIFNGPGTVTNGGTVTSSNNYTGASPGFLNATSYDYHLTSASPSGSSGIVDAGTGPGSSPEGFSLTPIREYVIDAASQPRTLSGTAIDVGAFEYGSTGSPTDTTPPVITSGPSVTNITTNGATVTWTTDDASDSVVEYSLNSSFSPSTNVPNSTPVTNHSVVLTGLTPNTLYYLRVRSTNAVSLTTTSAPVQFTTTAPPDTQAPTVSFTAPTNGVTVQGVVTVTVNATDNVGVSSVTVTEIGSRHAAGQTLGSFTSPATGTPQSGTYNTTWDTNDPVRGEPNGSVTLTARALDASNNAVQVSIVLTVQNSQAIPVVTAGPQVSIQLSGTTATATISWNTNVASTTAVQYGLERADGTFTYSPWIDNPALNTSHQVVLSNLQINTRYHYQIRSCDSSGNCAY